MAVKERAKVKELRVTRKLFGPNNNVQFVIRLWIESDEKHGGATREQAVADLDEALANIGETWDKTEDDLAEAIFEVVTSANSVEVCDEEGNGVTIHRDWP